MKYFQ